MKPGRDVRVTGLPRSSAPPTVRGSVPGSRACFILWFNAGLKLAILHFLSQILLPQLLIQSIIINYFHCHFVQFTELSTKNFKKKLFLPLATYTFVQIKANLCGHMKMVICLLCICWHNNLQHRPVTLF